MLSGRYHVILPTLDGHGEEYATPYVSTEATADKLLDYINEHCGGRLFESVVPNCTLYEAKGYNHGYLALYLPEEWLAIAGKFFAA